MTAVLNEIKFSLVVVANLFILIGFYNRVQAAVGSKNSNAKIILALGGWTDSSGDSYSRLVHDPEKRANFVQQAVRFLKVHKFDGLSLDWQYPVCWQSDCSKGPATDKAKFTELIKVHFFSQFSIHETVLSNLNIM